MKETGRTDVNTVVMAPGTAERIARDAGIAGLFDVTRCEIDFHVPGGRSIKIARFFIDHARGNPEEYGFATHGAANTFFDEVLDTIFERQSGLVIAHDQDDRFVERISDVVCIASGG